MELKAQINKKPLQMVPIWNKADWVKLKEKAAPFTTKFLSRFEDHNLHENWKDLEDHMKHLKNSIASKRTSTWHNLPWLTTEGKHMFRKKGRILKKAKTGGQDWSHYCKHQNNTSKALWTAYWNYINDILSDGLRSGKRNSFWSYIKSQQQDSVEWHHWGKADSSFRTLSLRLSYSVSNFAQYSPRIHPQWPTRNSMDQANLPYQIWLSTRKESTNFLINLTHRKLPDLVRYLPGFWRIYPKSSHQPTLPCSVSQGS